MDDWSPNLQEIKLAFGLFRESIGLFRSAKDLLPDSEEKKAAISALDAAERNAKLAEAKLAQNLGFQLCQKEFPPTPLLVTFAGKSDTSYRCPTCGTEYLSRRSPHGRIILRERQKAQDQQVETHE